jgi:hypothetical protein
MALDKPIEEIEEADLTALISNKVSERKTIEYKESIPSSWSDAGTKEFLADVSSLANCVGGHLIYGIKEKDGVPVALPGMDLSAPSETVTTLDSKIRDGIRPRLPGFQVWQVSLRNSRVAIVIRVPRSFAAPHMVTFGGSSRFFSRTSNGKCQLDVDEIRAAFILSDSLAQRVKEFRAERVSRILASEAPLPLCAGPKTVMHVVPLDAFSLARRFDSRSLKDSVRGVALAPIFHHGWNFHHNLDGLLLYHDCGNSTEAYAQLFRNGIVETADASFVSPYNGNKWVAGQAFEEGVIEFVESCMAWLRQMVVRTPVLIMLSMLGVAGYQMRRQSPPYGGGRGIDRENVIIPEVLADSFEWDVPSGLKEVFDLVWNAAGGAASPFYDDQGRRKHS